MAKDDNQEQDEDTDRTWVPQDTPTWQPDDVGDTTAAPPNEGATIADGPPAENSEDSFQKTVDLSADPRDESSDADSFTKTLVTDAAAATPGTGMDDEVAKTQVAPNIIDGDATQMFSRSMGMRRLSEEEYEEWQKEVTDRSIGDTAVVDVDGLSSQQSGSDEGRGTNIWGRQSSGGLDTSLMIRSRPVDGDDLFHSKNLNDANDGPDYRIIEKIAEGGMGAVYVATQTSLDRELAIKTLKPLKDSEIRTYTKQGRISQVRRQRREMFLSEALVTANLVHPHIIPIHDLCQTSDGSPFYSMKRVHGTPWNERLRKMSLTENLEVLHKVCDAVAYAHHNGVVNRDLKPENIMLGEFGEVLVLDWGLAVPASSSDRNRFATPSAAYGAGTPAYMSPELWTGPADAIGTWSDIYLLGAILFEIVTGTTPHQFPQPESSAGNSGLWLVIDSVVRANQIRKTNITGELMDIARKAMSTNPSKRHSSVLKFQEAIKSFQRHEESRRLTVRADETLSTVLPPEPQIANADDDVAAEAVTRPSPISEGSSDYQPFQTAVALYEEAGNIWPENDAARAGLRRARLGYAALAREQGDHDLGLQIVAQEEGEDFARLRNTLTRARAVRNGLKNVTLGLTAAMIIAGAVSFVQYVKLNQKNAQITALYGDKVTLEKQKQDAVAAREAAIAARETAQADRLQAVREREAALREEQTARMAAEAAEQLRADADRLRTLAEKERADAQLELADAQGKLTDVQSDLASVAQQVEELKEQKIRARVNLRNSEIANLIRNGDYPLALRGVTRMLQDLTEDDEFRRLPAVEREQRIEELRARERQLRRRAVATEAPVQTQAIDRSGHTVVWGDSTGRIRIWTPGTDEDPFSGGPSTELKLTEAVASVAVSDDGKLLAAAAGKTLHLWDLDRPDASHAQLAAAESRLVRVSVGGDFIMAASADGMLAAWDIRTREQRWSMQSSSDVRDFVLLPESGIFVYGGSRGGESADILAYRLPRADESRPQRLGQLKLPRNHNHPPLRLAASPDESVLLISNSRSGDVLALPRTENFEDAGVPDFPFVHAVNLKTDHVLTGHQRPVNDLCFSPDGRLLATASDDRTIGIWSVETDGHFAFRQRIEGHGARVNAVSFLDVDGKRLLSVSADRYSRVWHLSRYQKDHEELERTFGLRPLSEATSGIDTNPRRSEREYPVFRRPIPRRPRQIFSTARTSNHKARPLPVNRAPRPVARIGEHSPSHRWMLTAQPAGDSPSTSSADTSTPEYLIVNQEGNYHRGIIRSAQLNRTGNRLITGASDGSIVIWDAETGQPVQEGTIHSGVQGAFDEGHDFNVARLKFLPPQGDVLLTTGFDGNLCLWNADAKGRGAGAQHVRIPGLGLVNAISVADDGQILATSAAKGDQSSSGAMHVWAVTDLLQTPVPAPLQTLTGFHRTEISSIAIRSRDRNAQPDDLRFIATGGRDGRIAVWEGDQVVANGQVHSGNTIISHLEWTGENELLSAGFDGRLQILRIDHEQGGLEVVQSFNHDRIPVDRVAFSADRTQFVSISIRTDSANDTANYELQLWRPDQSQPVRSIRPAWVRGRRPQRVTAVNWASDGSRLAAVVDNRLHVFSTDNWKVTHVLEAPGLGISDVAFGLSTPSDHPTDVLATFDGTAAHLWNLNSRSHVADFRPLLAVQSVALCECANRSLVLTGDRAIRVFQGDEDSTAFGGSLYKVSEPHRGVITTIRCSPVPGATDFLTAGADGSAAIWRWNEETQQVIRSGWVRRTGDTVTDADWSPDGRHVLLVSQDGHIIFRPVAAAGNELDLIPATSEQPVLRAAAFSSDGKFFAVGGSLVPSSESMGWIYQVTGPASARLHCEISGHQSGGISSLAFLPDSPYIVTGGQDGAAVIWNWQPHRASEGVVRAYEAFQLIQDGVSFAHAAPVTSVSTSSDGRIATASEDGTAIVWRNPFRR